MSKSEIMTQGITLNGKHSFSDFGLYVSARDISAPVKKNVRVTVPFSSGFYDFSDLPGFSSFENRTLSYTFDVSEWTVEEMDTKRSAVLAWLASAQNSEIEDDSIPGYTITGSFDSVTSTEDWSGAELTVLFVCQPFFVAKTAESVAISDKTVAISNAGRLFDVKVSATTDSTLTYNGTQTSVAAGASLALPTVTAYGDVEFTVSGSVTLTFKRGRF